MNMPEGRYQNLTHFTRKCETCGKVMKHVGPTRRFCADCTRKRNRVQQGEYRARKAAMSAIAAGRTYGQQVEFERRQKELKDRGEI